MASGSPALHSVHIYDDETALIGRLCGIVTSAVQVGDAVLIIATAAHRNGLVKQLEKAGLDVRSAARDGRFTMIDAKETTSTFMRHGRPDRDLFMASVGQLLAQAKKNARGNERGLVVFGEMVAVLWDQGHKEAAVEVEGFWNEALNDRVFHLHCAYPRAGFVNPTDDAGLAAICQSHSHVVVQ